MLESRANQAAGDYRDGQVHDAAWSDVNLKAAGEFVQPGKQGSCLTAQ